MKSYYQENKGSKMIGIIDLDIGNIASVENALKFLGFQSKIIQRKEDFDEVEKIILPGVGSFGKGIEMLEKKELIEKLKEEIKSGKKFLGICLGMQLLFEKSEESQGVNGLNLIKGKVKKFRKGKVPQIGWNKVEVKENESESQMNELKLQTNESKLQMNKLKSKINKLETKKSELNSGYYYFVNSFYCVPENKEIETAKTNYEIEFVSAIESENIVAVQFHPEKSGENGLKFLEKWCKC